MLEALKSYIESLGYNHVFRDYLPAPEKGVDAIVLNEWSYSVPSIGGDVGTHYVQVIVRRSTYDEAKADAYALCSALNSGENEKLFNLSQEIDAVITTRRGAILYARDDTPSVSFYFEIALWG